MISKCELGPFAVMLTFIFYIWQINDYFQIGPAHKSAKYSIFYQFFINILLLNCSSYEILL
jgi:hypothetical protein